MTSEQHGSHEVHCKTKIMQNGLTVSSMREKHAFSSVFFSLTGQACKALFNTMRIHMHTKSDIIVEHVVTHVLMQRQKNRGYYGICGVVLSWNV